LRLIVKNPPLLAEALAASRERVWYTARTCVRHSVRARSKGVLP
jgi:hypothetical protein